MREQAEYTLTLVNSWISNIDSKTSHGLSVSGILSGFVLIRGVPKAFLLKQEAETSSVLAFIGPLVVILLYLSLLAAICLFANTLGARTHNTGDTSHLFFGDISHMQRDTYIDEFSKLSATDYEKEIADQIFTNSQICALKVKLYNIGLICLIAASILCFVGVGFQLIYLH